MEPPTRDPRMLRKLSAIITGIVSTVSLGAQAPADPADMKVEDLLAGADAKKRYFLIHRAMKPPKNGWRTLFVLPGGSGDASFQPFVTQIARHALPETYLVVQLVAPVWSPEQARTIVWPADTPRTPEAKFSTSEFFLAVLFEIAATHKLDLRYLFTLTWSSSGSNGYALALHPKSRVTGTFVAMSVFKPEVLPPLSKAKGHSFYLYHSAQDFIPLAQPEKARTALEKAGATVKLETYEGGHGWHGNVFGDIAKGIAWLEAQVGTRVTK